MKRHFLTTAQRKHLLLIYLADGYEAAKVLATEYGVSPHYASNLARRKGVTDNRARRFEHRWKRAIQAGEVRI